MIQIFERWRPQFIIATTVCFALCSSELVAADSGTAPAAASTASAGNAPEQAKFDIWEFRILGSHVLDTRVIERAVYPFLGKNGSIDTVKHAADALEKAYKDAGYATVFVDIPEQHVEDGIVRLKVTEGRLESVRIRGARYYSEGQILAALPALIPGQAPHLPSFQQQLSALNSRTADRSITPVLKAGAEPGTVDVDLAVKDDLPLHGSLEFDDRHTADTTPNRLTAALSYDNLWQRQDSIGLQYQTAPADPSQAEVLSTNYAAHIGDGLADFSYIHTSSNVLALGTLGVLGKGTIYGAHWVQLLSSTGDGSQSFNAGVDYKDVLTQVLPDSTGSTGSSSAVTAPVRYLNWSFIYSQDWRGPGHLISVNGGINFGVRSLINSPDQFENARYNGNPGYIYFRGSVSAAQSLPWGFGLFERLTGQWSADPLVNNEQFSLGGVETVRGYLEAETLGDSGGAATFEIHSPTPGSRFGSLLTTLYGYVFVDAGVTALVDPLPAQDSRVALWSNGVGLRLDNAAGFAGSVDYAIPRRPGTRTTKDEGRVDFSIRYGF